MAKPLSLFILLACLLVQIAVFLEGPLVLGFVLGEIAHSESVRLIVLGAAGVIEAVIFGVILVANRDEHGSQMNGNEDAVREALERLWSTDPDQGDRTHTCSCAREGQDEGTKRGFTPELGFLGWGVILAAAALFVWVVVEA